jgi:putative ABC transport system permease protein
VTLGTIVWRNIGRRKIRLALTLIAVAVAFLLFGVTAAIRQNFSVDGPPDAAQRLVTTSAIGMMAPLPVSAVSAIAQVKGVEQVAYRSIVAAYFREKRDLFLMMAVSPEAYLKLYPELTLPADQRAAFLADRGSILVGRTLASRFGWKVGERVPVNQRVTPQSDRSVPHSYLVAGIFDGASAQAGTGYALSHWAAFNEGRVVDRDMVSHVIVRSAGRTQNDAVAAAIDARFANSPFETVTATEEEFGRAQIAQLGDIQAITLSVMAAGFFAILLIVGSNFAAAIRERRREIGILRALGFLPNRIVAMLLVESCVVTAIGAGIGLTLASLAVRGLKATNGGAFGRLAITPAAWAQALVLILVFGMAVVLIPAWRAQRPDLATALRRS